MAPYHGCAERYFKWDKEGGDNYLAYKAAGRDENKREFALVGPFFKDPADAAEAAEIGAAVEECFPAVLAECTTAACRQVCEDSLAVLFHHRRFLLENCPYMHAHPAMDPRFAHLHSCVFVGYEDDVDCPSGHKPRGVPEHVVSRMQAEKVVRGACVSGVAHAGRESGAWRLCVRGWVGVSWLGVRECAAHCI